MYTDHCRQGKPAGWFTFYVRGDPGRLSSPFDLGLGEPTLQLELELFPLAPVG